MHLLEDINFFTSDQTLIDFLQEVYPDLYLSKKSFFEDFGKWIATEVEQQADYTDRYANPQLETYNSKGERDYKLIFNHQYESVHQEVYDRGVIAEPFKSNIPHAFSFINGYLLSQSDISIHCPVTMTGAVAYVLDRFAPEEIKEKYLPQVIAQDGTAKSGGTWATELHGGSDVGATTTRAIKIGNGWRLIGLKWFTSNAKSGIAVATARPESAENGSKGLGLYLVPSHLDDGSKNSYYIRRLKDKLGTKGLATGEIDLENAFCEEIAPPPHGLKIMMEALEYSRIHNAVGSAGSHRRAFMEALKWAESRNAFGKTIVDYPMVKHELLKLRMTYDASFYFAFESVVQFDKLQEDESNNVWLRLVTALAKYQTAEWAAQACKQSLELIGGNGYTTEFPISRILRDTLSLIVWEGPANIQALELFRLLVRFDGFNVYQHKFKEALRRIGDSLDGEKTFLIGLNDEIVSVYEKIAQARENGEKYARVLMEKMAFAFSLQLILEKTAINNSQRLKIVFNYLKDQYEHQSFFTYEKEMDTYFHELMYGNEINSK